MGVRSPAARGRVAVRSTALSRFLSQRSFIVHPAPRMTIEPIPKRDSIENSWRGGTPTCAPASVILHAMHY